MTPVASVKDRPQASGKRIGAPERFRVWLVIGHVYDRNAIGFHAVAQAKCRMVQILCLYADAMDIVLSFGQRSEADLRRQLVDLDRKICVLHLSGEHICQRRAYTVRRTDREFVPRHEKRPEKWEPLDMVPMGMTQQNRRPQRAGDTVREVESKGPRAGPAIEDQPLAVIGDQFDA